MILTVDIGNTTIAVGGFLDGELQFLSRLPTNTNLKSRDYEAALWDVLSKKRAKGAILSSVVPALDATLMEALCAVTENAPIKVSSSLKTGITFQGYDVDNLGMDRLVDLVAAKALVGAPVMVVDLGTCTTVSVLDQDCVFRGGMILPGIQVSLDAMNWRAAKLPALQASAPQQLIGQNTAQCMQSGAVIGAAAVIDGFADRVEAQLGYPVSVVITGGMGELVLPWCNRNIHYEANLLLKGLYHLYQSQ